MARPEGSPRKAIEITPAYCFTSYFYSALFCVAFALSFIFITKHIQGGDNCYLELFANSITNVSNASNVSNADWRIGFVARTPVTRCELTLRPINSRLLQRGVIMSKKSISSSSEFLLGQTIPNEMNLAFETAAMMPEVVNGGVVWDFRVEIVAAVKRDDVRYEDGLLMVFCDDIPVKFTADPAGNMIGSLLGSMRRCDYVFQDN